jgi:hypothetical protein
MKTQKIIKIFTEDRQIATTEDVHYHEPLKNYKLKPC